MFRSTFQESKSIIAFKYFPELMFHLSSCATNTTELLQSVEKGFSGCQMEDHVQERHQVAQRWLFKAVQRVVGDLRDLIK